MDVYLNHNSRYSLEQLKALINKLKSQADRISPDRLAQLDSLADIFQEQKDMNEEIRVTVICTHNSRRSHLGQLWIRTAAWHFGFENIRSYSGGVEVTCLNPRMAKAIDTAGFPIKQVDAGDNPKYIIPFSGDSSDHDVHFSKVYDDPYNPQKDFIAVIVCSSADAECPFVHGSSHRFYLPYEDPKEFDGTEHEAQAYTDKVEEIGREMLYLFSRLD